MTPNPRYRFEGCANGVESCLAAQQGGAHRVELCASTPKEAPRLRMAKSNRPKVTNSKAFNGGSFTWEDDAE